LKVIEAYPGQRLAADGPEGNFGTGMSPDVRKQVLSFLADHDVQLVNFGVVGLPNNEQGSRAVFEFAKDMGIETIVSEPEFEALDIIEKLADEYEIDVALHNHPRPSRYWDPQTVLKVTEGRSKRIGACADTGHWMRSDIKPVEAVRMLEGRIISWHFKDLNRYGGGAHDVPWGTGQADVPAILRECHRQGFEGVFSVEYEHNWLESLPEIAESVKFFDKVAAEILAG
jgi:sugar phosphate isomerase/epimerase